MQTRKKLAALTGTNVVQHGDGPLASIAEQLVAAFDAREAARFAAYDAAAAPGTGPHLAALQRLATEHATAALANNTSPCILRADLHEVLATAAHAAPADRGLRLAKAHAYRLWHKDPTGVLTVGDVARLRTHYTREHPRSKVASVLDHGVPAVGFNTLPLRRLFVVAGDIARAADLGNDAQATFEHYMQIEGLDGNKPEQIRARGYVRALLEGGSLADDPILGRQAQAIVDEPMDETGTDMPFDDESPMGDDLALEAPGEEALPHDEHSEVMTSIDSPITGEELVLELGLGGAGSMDGEADVGTPGLGLEHVGQLEDLAGGGGEAPTSTIIDDPSSPGDQLEVTLTPVDGDAAGPDLDDAAPEPLGLDEEPLELDAASIEKCADCGEKMAECCCAGGGEAEAKQAYAVYSVQNGVAVSQPIDTFHARGMMAALKRVASHGIKGSIHTAAKSPNTAVIALGGADYLIVRAADGASKAKAPTKGMPCPAVSPQPKDAVPALADAAKVMKAATLSVGDIRKVCAARGLTPESIEHEVLSGNEVIASTWSLRINDGNEVELTRVDTGRGRVASLIDLDEVIGDFMAHVACMPATGAYEVRPLFAVRCASCPATNVYVMPDEPVGLRCTACGSVAGVDEIAKQASREDAYTGYVVTADVPGSANERSVNSKRMFAAVKAVVADAQQAPSSDGKLHFEIKADDAALARVRKVLEDRYGVQAQMQQVGPAAMNPAALAPQPMQNMGPKPTQPGGAAPMTPQAGGGVPGTASSHDDEAELEAEAMYEVAYTGAGKAATRTVKVKAAGPGVAQALVAKHYPGAKIASVRKAQMAQPGMDPAADAPLDMAPPSAAPPMGGGGEALPAMPPEALPGMAPPPSSGLSLDEEEAVRAAITHFRNLGMGPIKAFSEFSSKYKELMTRFGDEESPGRHMAEAAVIRIAGDVYSKPALMQTAAAVKSGQMLEAEDDSSLSLSPDRQKDLDSRGFGAGGEDVVEIPEDAFQDAMNALHETEELLQQHAASAAVTPRKADLPAAKAPAQGKAKVSLPSPAKLLGKDSTQGHPASLNKPVKPQSKPQGKFSTPALGTDSSQGHPAGLNRGKPTANHPPKGKLPSKDLGNAEAKPDATTKSWDSVSKKAPSNNRSK